VKHISQGTISVIFGCHSPIHSLLILISWRILYNCFPKWWQIVCIFLHDWGHWGMNYLDDYSKKKQHWQLGASLAYKLYGKKGFSFCAGHTSHSGEPQSKLAKADKYSRYICPTWWVWVLNFIEPALAQGYATKWQSAKHFKAQVKDSVESGEFRSTHSFYLDRQCDG